jgi:hypothetical protein
MAETATRQCFIAQKLQLFPWEALPFILVGFICHPQEENIHQKNS